MRDMGNLLDLKAGVRIDADDQGYTITARASDDQGTWLTYKGS